jgi:hypothetical protein
MKMLPNGGLKWRRGHSVWREPVWRLPFLNLSNLVRPACEARYWHRGTSFWVVSVLKRLFNGAALHPLAYASASIYARPIAGRVTEEAGVPRHMFGQSEMGSVVIFHHPSIPHGKILRREFFQYLADETIVGKYSLMMRPIVRWVISVLTVKSEHRFAVVHYAERVISKVLRRQFRFKLLWSHLDGALFCFCVNKVAKNYTSQMDRGGFNLTVGSVPISAPHRPLEAAQLQQ